MNLNLDFIGGILLSAIVSAEKSTVLALLQSIHDKDKDEYEALVYGLKFALKKGAGLAGKTTTQLDDEVITNAKAILSESASANGLTLTFSF